MIMITLILLTVKQESVRKTRMVLRSMTRTESRRTYKSMRTSKMGHIKHLDIVLSRSMNLKNV